MNSTLRWLAYLGAACALTGGGECIAQPSIPAGYTIFTSPLTLENLDPGAFAVFVDGKESTGGLPKDGPRHVIWTQNSAPEWDGVRFGDSKTPGARYLRIGWKTAIPVGSVLTRGGVRISVLKPNAAYPGNMADDSQWIPAYRLKGAQTTREEPGSEDYALWALPPGTATRALRFTHIAALTDTSFAGWLGGATLLAERMSNIAPQALAFSRANTEKADRINDGSNNGTWGAWDNGDLYDRVVSSEHPEWVMLVWPSPVSLRGLNAIWAGFGEAEAQTYIGSATGRPDAATDANWKTIRSFDAIENQYPRSLSLNWLDFGTTITTRAIRLRITRVTNESHPHLNGKTKNGRRIWLGELFALQSLGSADLSTSLPPRSEVAAVPHPPIPIRFTLPAASSVTLVIENAQGRRVRNLVSDTHFPAGANIVWWDGADDLGRDTEAAKHGLYHVPPAFVPPGTYNVRGLYHQEIDLRYEFSVYTAGTPAWETEDHTGGWLANHSPPSSALFVPDSPGGGGGARPVVLVGSYVTEGGSGLAWLDLNGKKLSGEGWVGGVWTGAPYLARDTGPTPVPGIYAYTGAAWGELRLTALSKEGEKAVLTPTYKFPGKPQDDHNPNSAITGLAAYNGLLVAALPKLNALMIVDVFQHKQIATLPLSDPRGVAFDAQGTLLALTGKQLVRYPAFASKTLAARSSPVPEPLIASGLEDPVGITLDKQGNIYISDLGSSHQVKVFSPNGKLVRAIGHPGQPRAGSYDALHMNNPNGLTIDSEDRLWVAETDFQPKRISIWTLDGKLVNAFYGPAEYGGGGTLDPIDKTRFYFHGMEFQLDWRTGRDRLTDVFYRPGPNDLSYPEGFGTGAPPETPLYTDGKQYFTNCYNSNPTNGTSLAMIWRLQNGIARPVAALGRANDWALLKTDVFRSKWPRGVNLNGDYWSNQAMFAWSDLNDDGLAQPDEVTFWKAAGGGITVQRDLSFVASRVDDRTLRYPVRRFTPGGAPVYDPAAAETLAAGAQSPVSSGGDQAIASANGWTILTNAPKPYSPYGIGGVKKGVPLWSYPSLWPGLHASHESPAPEMPGEIIGTTRLLGGFFTPLHGEAGPLWAINGNMGNIYLFTADGLFVTQLFQDVRQGHTWTMPLAQRNMRLNSLTLHDENFWPSITQTADGHIYLCTTHPSLVRVDGLDTVRRLPLSTLRVTAQDLKNAGEYLVRSELARQHDHGIGPLQIAMRPTPPTVDGKLDDWQNADWAAIDKRGVAANFDSNSKPYNVTAALAVSGDRFYAAFKTGDRELVRNSGESATAPFKTGGALDLMLDTIEGGERLLVTQVKNKTLGLLYRPHVKGTNTEPIAFSSPWRTIKFDRVDDVSAQVALAADGEGNYELSVPLAVLNLKPSPGLSIKGDIGILRGNGFQTVQRVYWSNKATAIVADVPSEAELSPKLWGIWRFQSAPQTER